MKIGFLITGLGTGGAENHLLKLVPSLDCETFVVSMLDIGETGQILKKKGVKVYSLGFKKYNILGVINKLRKILKDEKPDVLDTYLIHANIMGRLFGRVSSVKVLINSVRNDYQNKGLLRILEKKTRKYVTVHFVNSRYNQEMLHKDGIEIYNTYYIPNCVDVNDFMDVNKIYKKYSPVPIKGSRLIMYHGRFHKVKQLETLIRAMSLLPNNYELVLFGEGDQEANYLNEIIKHNIMSKIIINDNLNDKKELFQYLNIADMFVLPSESEGMSNSLMEAMALGKRCVVSNIPQNKELIKNNSLGDTFELYNHYDLARKIRKSFRNKRKFNENAKTYIYDNHSISVTKKKYMNIVERMLEIEGDE